MPKQEPEDYVNVTLQDIKTGKKSETVAFKVPKPGEVTIWDARMGHCWDDLLIMIDWPMKKNPET